MKELSGSVNVSTYVSVNFEEIEESFKFSNALGARHLNWTDLVSAGWFKGTRAHTQQPRGRTQTHTEWLSKQHHQHINRCNQTHRVLKRVESVTCMIKGPFEQLKSRR